MVCAKDDPLPVKHTLSGGYAPLHPRFTPLRLEDVDQSIPQRFRRIVTTHADRAAIRFEGASITYSELDIRSNRIANALIESMTQRSSPVALMFNQGPAFVTALVGILKAGRIAMPLDPGSSSGELRNLIRHANAACVVHDDQHDDLACTIISDPDCHLDIDELHSATPICDPNIGIRPDAGASLYYTSGTTGGPKGVYDCHRNILHNILRYTNSLQITVEDRLSLLQSPNFSGTLSSIFGALLNGACLCPHEFRSSSPFKTARWMQEQGITIYHSVPSIFRSIANTRVRFPNLRVVRLEGDTATALDVRLFNRITSPNCILVNGLGTTETGLVCQNFVDHGSDIAQNPLPVGRATQDMEVLVVGDDLQPVATGTTGEIIVRSRYLALGYWRDDERTRAAFRHDDRYPGSRTYLTGDLGRLNRDGHLTHLGRKDSQVRIHGHTIDLADVESALLRVEVVKEAIATVIRRNTDAERIAAFYVPSGASDLSQTDLRHLLESSLPRYAVPSVIVALDSLPVSRAGKLDRDVLSRVVSSRPDLDQPYVAAASLLELEIIQIWEQILGFRGIGSADNFFDLGGTSLMAISMLLELDRAFHVNLDSNSLLSNLTVSSLARLIQSTASEGPQQITRLREVVHSPPLFYLHGDYLSGGYYCLRLAKQIDPAIPFFTVSPIRGSNISGSIGYEEMADRLLQAIRQAQEEGPYFLAGTCNGGMVAYEIARRLRSEGETVALLALFSASAANIRFLSLSRLTRRIASLLRLSDTQEESAFVRIREIVLNLKAQRGLGKIGYALGKIHRLPRELWRLVRPAKQKPNNVEQPSDIWRTYQAIDKAYIPNTYEGTVTLIWPQGEPESAAEASENWRCVAGNVRSVELSGTHHSCLTNESEQLGFALSEAYLEARRQLGARQDKRLR